MDSSSQEGKDLFFSALLPHIRAGFQVTSQRPSWSNFNKGFLISFYCSYLQNMADIVFLFESNGND